MSTGCFDELLARAAERAEAPPTPRGWGYRVKLDEGETFIGRWRGESEDPDNDDDQGKPRRIFLLWDADDEIAFSRSYAALAREVDRERPSVGDRVAIVRAADYATQKGTGYAFGLVAEACGDPLPAEPDTEPPPTAAAESDDDIPF